MENLIRTYDDGMQDLAHAYREFTKMSKKIQLELFKTTDLADVIKLRPFDVINKVQEFKASYLENGEIIRFGEKSLGIILEYSGNDYYKVYTMEELVLTLDRVAITPVNKQIGLVELVRNICE